MPQKNHSSPSQPCVWDYNLSGPQSEARDLWYLQRKLQFGDFSGLKRVDLIKYLPRLNIAPSLKELLTNFLHSHD